MRLMRWCLVATAAAVSLAGSGCLFHRSHLDDWTARYQEAGKTGYHVYDTTERQIVLDAATRELKTMVTSPADTSWVVDSLVLSDSLCYYIEFRKRVNSVDDLLKPGIRHGVMVLQRDNLKRITDWLWAG